MRRAQKKSFLEQPEMEVLNAAITRARDDIQKLPSLLEGQESNLFLTQATELAVIETSMGSEAVDHLLKLYRLKLQLLDNKVQLIEWLKSIPTSSATNTRLEELATEMTSYRQKLLRRDLTFLKGNVQQHSEEPAKHSRTVSFHPEVYAAKPEVVPSSILRSSAKVEKPQFTSDMGRRMTANMEAQQSARKARREGMTPAPTTASCQRSLPVPSTVEDKENKPATNVFQSGGSSLDGSFYANGVTYEDMMRPPSVTPSKLPQPNFDETSCSEIDECELPRPKYNELLTPLKLLPSINASLGPIPGAEPTNQPPPPRATHFNPLTEKPTRPTFTSMLGQKLAKN